MEQIVLTTAHPIFPKLRRAEYVLHQNRIFVGALESEQICLWVLPSCITIRRTSFAHAVQFGSLGRTTSPSLSAASSYMLIIFPQMNSAQVKSSWLPHCRFAALYTTASGCRDRNSSAEPCSSGCEASGQEGFISDGSVVDFTDGSPPDSDGSKLVLMDSDASNFEGQF